MNAIDFLIKEHNKVRQMLKEISAESHRGEAKKNLFEILCDDLLRHETMEHKVWYPHFKNNSKLSDTVKHLLTEEKSTEKAIAQFDNLKTEAAWEEKFSKFRKDVIHHAAEEERDLFPEVRKLLSEAELEQIGKEMQAFKKEHIATQ